MQQAAKTWLDIQCQLLPGITGAALVLTSADKDKQQPAIVWPGEEQAELAVLAHDALVSRKTELKKVPDPNGKGREPQDQAACPLMVDTRLIGAVAVTMVARPLNRQKEIIRQLQAGSVWLETLVRQQTLAAQSQLALVVRLVASSLDHPDFTAATMNVTSELALALDCSRVSLGFLRGSRLSVDAISNTTLPDSRSSLVQALGACMQEALDQRDTVLYPDSRPQLGINHHHRQFHKEHNSTLCTVVLPVDTTLVGALTLERSGNKTFTRREVEQAELIGSLIGPVLAIRRRSDRGILRTLREDISGGLGRLFGPGHLLLKTATTLIALFLVLAVLATGEYQVTSPATLEATIQRVVIAPQDGFLAQGKVRPGDVVHKGDLLGTLDDQQLKLEQKKIRSRLQQLARQYRQSFAHHDRSEINIIRAKINQAKAQLNLVGQELRRTHLLAPFDGVIVSGDLSQSLGAPVKRGDILFTVAPLDHFLLALQVDERDIDEIAPGQEGTLVLQGMVGRKLPLRVSRITPVASLVQHKNCFRVEADLDFASDLLRPGMTGVAKIPVGRRRLLWITTHRFLDWLRLKLWSLLP